MACFLHAIAASFFPQPEATLAKALLWIVVAIFIIGLLVVIGIFDLIF